MWANSSSIEYGLLASVTTADEGARGAHSDSRQHEWINVGSQVGLIKLFAEVRCAARTFSP